MSEQEGGESGFAICDWCGEAYLIKSCCECKKLASNLEWLDKAGLMVKPISCDKCGDDGEVWIKDNTVDDGTNMRFDGECRCIKDPRSLYNFIKKCKMK